MKWRALQRGRSSLSADLFPQFRELQPEKRLWIEVIIRAINDYYDTKRGLRPLGLQTDKEVKDWYRNKGRHLRQLYYFFFNDSTDSHTLYYILHDLIGMEHPEQLLEIIRTQLRSKRGLRIQENKGTYVRGDL